MGYSSNVRRFTETVFIFQHHQRVLGGEKVERKKKSKKIENWRLN
jgi:hypothetical protein